MNNKNEIFLLVEQGNKEEATLKLEGAQKIFDAAKEELNSADDDNRSIAQEQFDKAVAELREAKKEFESSNVIVYKKASDNTVVTAAELPDILAEYGVAKTVYRTIKVPLMTMITHPSIAIEEGNITFDMSITQMAEDNSSNELNAETEMGIKHGPFTMGVKAKISHKSEQTRKTDTTAKYHVDVKVKRQDPPEALNKVLDLMMNGINPIRVAEPK
nr:DUF2589 domain-containing protein [Francisella hispaniensis]